MLAIRLSGTSHKGAVKVADRQKSCDAFLVRRSGVDTEKAAWSQSRRQNKAAAACERDTNDNYGIHLHFLFWWALRAGKNQACNASLSLTGYCVEPDAAVAPCEMQLYRWWNRLGSSMNPAHFVEAMRCRDVFGMSPSSRPLWYTFSKQSHMPPFRQKTVQRAKELQRRVRGITSFPSS